MPTFDSARRDFAPYGFTCVWWTPSHMQRFDRHNEIEVNLLDRGALTYMVGGRRVRIPAGRLAMFWAAIPHRIVAFDRCSPYRVMTLPLGWFLHWRLDERLVGPVLHGEVVLDADVSAYDADRLRFDSWMRDAGSTETEARRVCLLEVEARMRRFAMAMPRVPHRAGRRALPALGDGAIGRAEAMAAYIAGAYTEPVTPAGIARHVGLHKNYAMAVFRRAFGGTLVDHITQHRLSHAQRLLATTDDRIADIAFASGFGSLSRFNEAFRRAFACTPRSYRRQNESPGSPQGDPLTASLGAASDAVSGGPA